MFVVATVVSLDIMHNQRHAHHRTAPTANPTRHTQAPTWYYMPSEEDPHEGTWLQWPHDYGWDDRHVARYEATWVEMTQALHTGERVHIIVYDRGERRRVRRYSGAFAFRSWHDPHAECMRHR